MSDQTVPILRLELAGMKHTIQTALLQHAEGISGQVQAAVDKFCTYENLEAIIKQQVESVVTQTVKSEIDDYFRYGAGRAAVRAAVLESFEKEKT